MINICSVPFCKSRKGQACRNKGISFHEFPSDLELREKWLIAICRKDADSNKLWVPKSRSVVCSLHFTNTCFRNVSKNRCLKPGSIPSIFPGYPAYLQNRKICVNPHIVSQDNQIPLSSQDISISHSITEPEPGVPQCTETEAIYNENLPLLDQVHQNQMPDINSNCTKYVPFKSLSTTEMTCQRLKTKYETASQNIRLNNQISLSSQDISISHNVTKPEVGVPQCTETEAIICNENLSLLDKVHQNQIPDINSNCTKSVPFKSLSITEIKCKTWKTKYQNASRNIRRLKSKMEKLKEDVQRLRDSNKTLGDLVSKYNISQLEESIKRKDRKALFLKDQLSSLNKKKTHWSDCTLRCSTLLCDEAPNTYHFLRKMNVLSLPSRPTLKRFIDLYAVDYIP